MEVVWSLAILMCLVKLYHVNAHKVQSGIQLSEEFAAWDFRSNIWIKVFLGAAEAPQGVSLIIMKSIWLPISRCRNLILILFINYNSGHSEFTFSDYTLVCFR